MQSRSIVSILKEHSKDTNSDFFYNMENPEKLNLGIGSVVKSGFSTAIIEIDSFFMDSELYKEFNKPILVATTDSRKADIYEALGLKLKRINIEAEIESLQKEFLSENGFSSIEEAEENNYFFHEKISEDIISFLDFMNSEYEMDFFYMEDLSENEINNWFSKDLDYSVFLNHIEYISSFFDKITDKFSFYDQLFEKEGLFEILSDKESLEKEFSEEISEKVQEDSIKNNLNILFHSIIDSIEKIYDHLEEGQYCFDIHEYQFIVYDDKPICIDPVYKEY